MLLNVINLIQALAQFRIFALRGVTLHLLQWAWHYIYVKGRDITFTSRGVTLHLLQAVTLLNLLQRVWHCIYFKGQDIYLLQGDWHYILTLCWFVDRQFALFMILFNVVGVYTNTYFYPYNINCNTLKFVVFISNLLNILGLSMNK